MNPNWKPGDPILSPVTQMITLNEKDLDPKTAYKLLIGSIVPRPIALISTLDSQGVGNLAPFSFFNGVSSHPPALMFSVTRKPDGGKKDTLLNIEATRQFVVNTVSEWMIEAVNHCSGEFPHGVNEMKLAGFTALQSTRVSPPRVKESPIQLECELLHLLEVGNGSVGSSVIVVGQIVAAHVDQRVYSEGRIDPEKLQPIARLGGLNYSRTSGIFELARPKVET